jgi:ABC-2 type transport system permease protein
VIALRKYAPVAWTTAQSSLAYPTQILVRLGFMAVVMVVFSQLWAATFAGAGSELLGGYSYAQIMWYLVITETVAMAPRIDLQIDTEIRTGDVAYKLVKPYSYLRYHLAGYVGECAARLPLTFAVGTAVALAAGGPGAIPWLGLVPGLVTLGLALLLTFTFEVLIGLAALWFEETSPFFWIYQKLTFTVGGLFLPFELFPDWLRTIAEKLPLAWMLYGPGSVMVHPSWQRFGEVLLGQLIWLALMAGLILLLFRRGTRQLAVHGG